MDAALLELQNIWWRNPIEQDFHLKKLALSRYQYKPALLIVSELKKGIQQIHTIIGPRQIGKTTYLKLLIRDLLPGADPLSFFYYSCENISKQQLRETLLFYLTSLAPAGKKYLFLDEISFVEGWEEVELELYNKGLLQEAVIINSGSSSLNLKKSAEKLPGRKGVGKVHYYFPLTFYEFVQLTQKDAAKLIKNPLAHIAALNTLLLDYVRASGFPYLINTYFEKKMIDDSSYDIYKDWIEGEITKAKRSVTFAYHIFSRILESLSSQVNWESLAQHSSIRSHTTIAEYVDLFDSLFIAKVVPFIGSDLKVKIAKNKKIYFFDHFLFSVVEKNIFNIKNYNDYFNQKVTEEMYLSKFIENIVFSNILKQVVQKGYPLQNSLFYWRNKTQQEIDFLVVLRKGRARLITPIEVKYRRHVEPSTIKTFHPLILTRERHDERYNMVPTVQFLLQMDKFVKT